MREWRIEIESKPLEHRKFNELDRIVEDEVGGEAKKVLRWWCSYGIIQHWELIGCISDKLL